MAVTEAVSVIPSLFSGLPFIGVLLSISLMPLLIPKFWHRFENPILAGWAIISLIILAELKGGGGATLSLAEVMLHEYLPFIILLTTLYVISGGLHIQLKAKATPITNTAFLFSGAILSSFVGTTGAAMLLIRPFIRMNQHRHYQAHNIIFFIFIVANVGGCLTPLGDPPLFIGYLNGVDFFWTLKHLTLPLFITIVPLLILYLLVDWGLAKHENSKKNLAPQVFEQFKLEGKGNLLLLLGVLGIIVGTNMFEDKSSWNVWGCHIPFTQIIRDGGLLILAAISYIFTPKEVHKHHHFSWAPISEVARVFAAVFITMIPVNLMLLAGEKGPFSPLLAFANGYHQPFVYFWLSGIFSSFLDNAPTYLIFFKMAGGNAENLMGPLMKVLMAISLGSVFMGAMTYIGNAPNFMVRSIAKQSGIQMPSFLGYMLWSGVILLPIFLGVSLWLFW